MVFSSGRSRSYKSAVHPQQSSLTSSEISAGRTHSVAAQWAALLALSALLALLAVLTVRSRFDDPDMWWHLALGKLTWTNHSIPLRDVFSYTTGHYPSVPHEWLSQVTIYGAYKLAGSSGLMGWLCVLGSLLLIGSYALCSLYSGNAKVAFLGALATWLFATVGLSIRPQMIGYLLLVFELLMLHLGQIFLLHVQAPIHHLSQLFSSPPGLRPAHPHADRSREPTSKISSDS